MCLYFFLFLSLNFPLSSFFGCHRIALFRAGRAHFSTALVHVLCNDRSKRKSGYRLGRKTDSRLGNCKKFLFDRLIFDTTLETTTHSRTKMATRKAKQRKFESKRRSASSHLMHDAADHDGTKAVDPLFPSQRELIVYTWGNRRRSAAPRAAQRNFDASGLSHHSSGKRLNLKEKTGMDSDLKEDIMESDKFQAFARCIALKVETKDISVISVCCHQGRHRSVSIANHLKDVFFPNAVVVHLEIGKHY